MTKHKKVIIKKNSIKNKNIKKNGLKNVVEGIARDYFYRNAPVQHLNSTFYNTRYELFTLQRTELTYRYASDGMFRTIVDQPVLDAFKGELTIKTDELNNDEIEQLDFYIKQNSILEKVKQFFIYDRLFGGAGLIIEVIGQDLKDEFNINSIEEGQKLNFVACDRWELTNNPYNTIEQLKNQIKPWDNFNYYGKEINNNRVIILQGKEAPSLIRQTLQGWGLSAVEPLVAPLNVFDKIKNVIYELLDEAKIDVWKLADLNSTLISGQDGSIKQRVEITNLLKNYQNAIVMDSEDDFIQKQLNLSGLAEILQQLRLEISAAMKMPLTKIFGLSASGFNSGEDDIENYNSWVEAEMRSKVYIVLQKVINIICKSLFGIVPRDLQLSFPELKTPKLEEIETKRLNTFKIGVDLYNNKLITSKEIMDYLDQEQIFTMDTKAKNGELPEFSEGLNTQNRDYLDI